jgi:polysaccharidase protein
MTIYYVDAINGSDSNRGTSSESAFKSVAQVSSIKLKPGDQVLLARGSTFSDMLTINGSGTPDQPITIGAYGAGADPKFVGKQGIYGTKAANIVIEHLAFETGYNAIYAAQAQNWVIDSISLVNAGHATGTGSISMKTSTNVTISNSKFDNVSNDAIYVVDMNGLNIKNNVITNPKGSTADGIQVTNSNNVRVEGNKIDLSGSTDSTKGGIIMNGTNKVVATNNTVNGGSFGIAINGWDVAITDNKISNQNKYVWSSAILVSQGANLGNYTISGNKVSGSNFGIALTGLSRDGDVTRENIRISDNVFVKIATATLKIDKAASGSFVNNLVVDSTVTQIRGAGLNGSFDIQKNVSSTSAVVADALKQTATTPAAAIADFIVSASTDAKSAAAERAAAQATAKAEAEKLLKAEAEAAKSYAESASENLNKIQKVGINADRYSLDVGGHKVIGNVLANDINASGKMLALRTVDGARVDANKGLDIKGKYGTLHVNADGYFTYTLDTQAWSKLKSDANPVESFQYKAADGSKIASSTIAIDLGAYVQAKDSTSAAANAARKAGMATEKATAVDDFYKIGANAQTVTGNVSTNDLTADGGTLSLRTVGGSQLSGGSIDLKGNYGTLHIDASGAFSYTLDANATAHMQLDAKAVDSFVYKAAIGGSYDQAALVIDLSSHVPAGDVPVL